MNKSYPVLLLFLLLFQNCSKPENLIPNVPKDFTVPDTKDIIMYEINIGSFSNKGNLSGIIDRLDSIAALGINTIWLMPIHPIGQLRSFGSPYCVKDFSTVNPEIGDIEDLKKLVDEAHKRKIAVILDWVSNHTAWDHPWITEHPNWYTQDLAGNIISPPGTNWTDVADLNFNNPEMRLALISAMDYWITEAKIDGYRCDAADLVPFDFWQQSITSLNKYSTRKLIFLAEGTRDDHFDAGFQMNFSWDYYNAIKNVFTSNGKPYLLHETNSNEYQKVPLGKRKLRFTTNHDLSNDLTPLNVFGNKKAALAASVATIFMSGVPLIYSGQEIGVDEPSIYTTGKTIDWSLNSGLLSEYTTILQFYKNSDVAKNGLIRFYNNDDFIIFKKTLGLKNILVLINSRGSDKTFIIPSDLHGNWKNVMTNKVVTLSDNLHIEAHEFLLLQN